MCCVGHPANLEVIFVLIERLIDSVLWKGKVRSLMGRKHLRRLALTKTFLLLQGCFFQMSNMGWSCDSNLRCLFWSNPLVITWPNAKLAISLVLRDLISVYCAPSTQVWASGCNLCFGMSAEPEAVELPRGT